ncbi:crossover junction endodeoxyribonuclease RuvC [Nocardiopsis sp. HUAS JQ3]|uniref:crossover junction endodeoxyribonuclease RuvC n=1 Tax=Nocardiopsis sp. HUAS JQ3 TaxID=3061629 RepID=UPI0023A9DD52|nr:crossover junction endodeoxyribonuclease RuvC [Nocardiopsis sp. HUAS JQ3]WDZ91168.1 crossover junction endodeoxyribonuclease RuvC [Nocardiopsis sp. HUAS JQ3]
MSGHPLTRAEERELGDLRDTLGAQLADSRQRTGDAPPVLGLDLAAEASGYALIPGPVGTITAPKAKGKTRTLDDNLARLDVVEAAVAELLDVHRPRLVVLEDYAPGARGASAHRLAEVSGTVRLACRRRAIPLVLAGVGQIKQYATGKGTATKVDMALALYKRAGVEFADDNQVDAWWAAALGADHLGVPPVIMPAAHRAVLDRITWPVAGQDVTA